MKRLAKEEELSESSTQANGVKRLASQTTNGGREESRVKQGSKRIPWKTDDDDQELSNGTGGSSVVVTS